MVVRPRFGLRPCAEPLEEDSAFGFVVRDRVAVRAAEDEAFDVERRVSVLRALEFDACLSARDFSADRLRDDEFVFADLVARGFVAGAFRAEDVERFFRADAFCLELVTRFGVRDVTFDLRGAGFLFSTRVVLFELLRPFPDLER